MYIWADGVHFNVRLGDERLAALVIIGVRPDGTKEVIAIDDRFRESTESWLTVLRDLKQRGMQAAVVAVGDGALAEASWRRCDGRELLPLVRAGERFEDGVRVERTNANKEESKTSPAQRRGPKGRRVQPQKDAA